MRLKCFCCLGFLISGIAFSGVNTTAVTKEQLNQVKYYPNLTLGGARYFHSESSYAGIYHLWSPLWYNQTGSLFFTDLRVFDRSGGSFEGNLHLGYRNLDQNREIMWGLYGGFDQRRSPFKNQFQQLVFGGELWLGSWFIGGNFYQPLGKRNKELPRQEWREREVQSLNKETFGNYQVFEYQVQNKVHQLRKKEEMEGGGDFEVGYAWKSGITNYLGGYYFKGENTKRMLGGRTRITYEFFPKKGEFIERVNFEGGVQYDNVRHTIGYLGLTIRFGVSEDKVKRGFERHMEDLVRRDPDIVVDETKEEEYYKESHTERQGGVKEEDGFFYPLTEEELWNRGLHDLGLDDTKHLSKKAFLEKLEKTHRKLALEHHPDRGGELSDFIYYNEAYELIKYLSERRSDVLRGWYTSKVGSLFGGLAYSFGEKKRNLFGSSNTEELPERSLGAVAFLTEQLLPKQVNEGERANLTSGQSRENFEAVAPLRYKRQGTEDYEEWFSTNKEVQKNLTLGLSILNKRHTEETFQAFGSHLEMKDLSFKHNLILYGNRIILENNNTFEGGLEISGDGSFLNYGNLSTKGNLKITFKGEFGGKGNLSSKNAISIYVVSNGVNLDKLKSQSLSLYSERDIHVRTMDIKNELSLYSASGEVTVNEVINGKELSIRSEKNIDIGSVNVSKILLCSVSGGIITRDITSRDLSMNSGEDIILRGLVNVGNISLFSTFDIVSLGKITGEEVTLHGKRDIFVRAINSDSKILFCSILGKVTASDITSKELLINSKNDVTLGGFINSNNISICTTSGKTRLGDTTSKTLSVHSQNDVTHGGFINGNNISITTFGRTRLGNITGKELSTYSEGDIFLDVVNIKNNASFCSASGKIFANVVNGKELSLRGKKYVDLHEVNGEEVVIKGEGQVNIDYLNGTNSYIYGKEVSIQNYGKIENLEIFNSKGGSFIINNGTVLEIIGNFIYAGDTLKNNGELRVGGALQVEVNTLLNYGILHVDKDLFLRTDGYFLNEKEVVINGQILIDGEGYLVNDNGLIRGKEIAINLKGADPYNNSYRQDGKGILEAEGDLKVYGQNNVHLGYLKEEEKKVSVRHGEQPGEVPFHYTASQVKGCNIDFISNSNITFDGAVVRAGGNVNAIGKNVIKNRIVGNYIAKWKWEEEVSYVVRHEVGFFGYMPIMIPIITGKHVPERVEVVLEIDLGSNANITLIAVDDLRVSGNIFSGGKITFRGKNVGLLATKRYNPRGLKGLGDDLGSGLNGLAKQKALNAIIRGEGGDLEKGKSDLMTIVENQGSESTVTNVGTGGGNNYEVSCLFALEGIEIQADENITLEAPVIVSAGDISIRTDKGNVFGEALFSEYLDQIFPGGYRNAIGGR